MALYRALGAVPDSAVELHNQLTYYQPRCSGVDTTHFLQPVLPAATAAVVPSGVETDTSQIASAPSRDSTASDSTPRDSARTAHTRAPRSARPEHADSSAAKPHGKYTLQVAAYTSKSDAEHLAKKLSARGLEARVVGTSTLYRVRIGRYETRAEAGAAAKALKDKKIDAFVTEAGPSDP
jgi:cell division protein FtsN